MDFIWFLIIGGIAGWIAGEIMRGHGFGILGNIAVGIVGALIGGFLFGAYGLVGSLISATVGSIILLFILNLIGRRTA
ncbi:MAG TPA: GlsB/YeaQ/YmgE family stress response membrane protein [Candidatus Peribacteraceae bacterium]|nr:GlsB/YeaQ/YmgE family stress response membrane protein [Candidatus Peribacteraceae bacterium]